VVNKTLGMKFAVLNLNVLWNFFAVWI